MYNKAGYRFCLQGDLPKQIEGLELFGVRRCGLEKGCLGSGSWATAGIPDDLAEMREKGPERVSGRAVIQELEEIFCSAPVERFAGATGSLDFFAC